jgi:site-specific DNA-methyltransferase (adenine-specific)
VIADPPYAETNLEWDAWPEGWVQCAASIAPAMWCFGSMRMFLDRAPEFYQWRFAQDIIWEKQNGSSLARDRFRRVHEHALHFYRGPWRDIYKATQLSHDAVARTVKRRTKPAHWARIGEGSYQSEAGGGRMLPSVLYARNCHGYAVNETQKPEEIVAPLIAYSCPPGGTVVSLFADSGTDLLVARKSGRRAIGFEKREEQCEAAAARLSQSELMAGVA